jgi:RimJ/RimL family protein N-acetyltransferase
VNIPIIETERLVLREWREEDVDPYFGMFSDPRVSRFVAATPSRADAWRSIAVEIGHWQIRGYGRWAVTRKETGAFIGRAGLLYPEGWPDIELAWALAPAAWGHGFATEAARAAMDYGFGTLGLERLTSNIDPENEPSQRVAQRLGETKGPRVHLVWSSDRAFDVDVWEITRIAWEAHR